MSVPLGVRPPSSPESTSWARMTQAEVACRYQLVQRTAVDYRPAVSSSRGRVDAFANMAVQIVHANRNADQL